MTPKTIKAAVDRLGEVKAAIATLEQEEDTLARKLKAQGVGVYSGVLFDANIFSQDREAVDWKGLAHEVGFTTRQKNKYTKPMVSTLYCKVTARMARSLAVV